MSASPKILWREAFRSKRLGPAARNSRQPRKGFEPSRSAHARLALFRILERCHAGVSLVEIRNWPRHVQGNAYVWAVDYLAGHENLPKPWET